jgi:hypothetical protein
MRRDKGPGGGSNVEALLGQYAELAILHGQALSEADHKSANRLHSRITRIYNTLQALGDEARNELLALLEHPEMSVRSWAAAHALDFAPERGEPVLAQIAAEGPMPFSLSAETVLDAWRASKP